MSILSDRSVKKIYVSSYNQAVIEVLLIEDSFPEAKLLAQIFKGSPIGNFQLTHVQRLSGAIEILKTREFDVALLDLTLPDSVGLESLDALISCSPELPVVVLTNTSDDQLSVEAVRRGAQDYLVKRQVNLELLVRAVRYAIERKQNATALQVINESLELRVAERTKELEATNQLFLRAQRLESLGTLASGIAHDLNNILTPILAVAQLLPLRLTNLDDRTRNLLTILESSAHRGAELIQQILSFGRGLEGKQVCLQLPHLLRDVEKILKETLPKSIDLEIDVADGLWMVLADITQLHQILMNLCINARDAMPQGGLLQIGAENYTVATGDSRLYSSAGDYVMMTVTDNGEGIPSHQLDQIFDPFFTTKDVGQGTGLGLSAVLGIVKSHGGFVDVVSKVNEGSQFQVYLPVCEKMEPPQLVMEELARGQEQVILVVDDEAAIGEMMRVTLEFYNYRVFVAQDSTTALAIFGQHANKIDLVLVDVMMPAIDGFATVEAMQRIRPKVNVVLMSGMVSSEMRAQAEPLGCRAFLAKPFTTNDLMLSVQESLEVD
jgi:two-component system, cell cycle sensor histidine kinase and response regulator CckA